MDEFVEYFVQGMERLLLGQQELQSLRIQYRIATLLQVVLMGTVRLIPCA